MFSRVFVLLRYDCCACPTYKVIKISSFVVCFSLGFCSAESKEEGGWGGGGGLLWRGKRSGFSLSFLL